MTDEKDLTKDQVKADNTLQNKTETISIIYHTRNDSPKYFEIKRSRLYLFFIGLPTITLIALSFGTFGLISSNPIHLVDNYRQTSKAHSLIANQEKLEEKVELQEIENNKLKSELEALEKQKTSATPSETAIPANPSVTGAVPVQPDGKCPPMNCPASVINSTINPIGLSTLSLFKPIQGQKDRSRPAVINLSGFKTAIGRDNVNLQFNIIPAVTDDSKISGHIIVLMKNELAIEVYPLQALSGGDFQINYSAGEPFATQRFRPVDASFIKPRKSGNYSFTVFIFSRTGDLIHYQSVNLPLKL